MGVLARITRRAIHAESSTQSWTICFRRCRQSHSRVPKASTRLLPPNVASRPYFGWMHSTTSSASARPPDIIKTSQQPVLIDEWQRHPPVWDLVRRAVDDTQRTSRFLLTGSAAPKNAPIHSAATCAAFCGSKSNSEKTSPTWCSLTPVHTRTAGRTALPSCHWRCLDPDQAVSGTRESIRLCRRFHRQVSGHPEPTD
ncbi:hypothetical protein SAMN05216368_10539 [Cryobacterium flavum]|uniref:AAA domain-containing protein n=1 Tax=Cryobacterium flavum TaxID=1424659 RepID=A0A5E9FXI7_9MICO|nr:hypothetical protein SAMN05216368_10539 [Cryobacterium flavum]